MITPFIDEQKGHAYCQSLVGTRLADNQNGRGLIIPGGVMR